MKKNIFNKVWNLAKAVLPFYLFALLPLSSCSDFLDEQKPQGTLSDYEVSDPEKVEDLIISAYAVLTTAEDINSSFSMWNYDVRSDDAYKGGSSTNDGDVFHQLEVEKGVLTNNWNINDIWVRLYNLLSRTNSAIKVIEQCDDSYSLKEERLAEMKFLRAYGHFLLKRMFKNIPFVMNPEMSEEEYNSLSNREYTNDEGWALIAKELEDAYAVLPVKQADKGRPTKAACAAFLAKVYLYKAYHQDDVTTNQVTSVNEDDLKKVIEYTNPTIYAAGGYGLENDFHNNFRPEEQYENGVESLWAIQYSRNDGSTYGNLNWSYGLIVPNIPDVTDGGCDFYKPTQNLVNAFKTGLDGLPMANCNDANYEMTVDNADPRLFLTVGITGLPYMFNKKFIMDKSSAWSRSGGIYGYYVTLKHNVDPDLIGSYLIHGSYWASSMNRIVFRYADVLLMRAEAEAQLGNAPEAVALVNTIRSRAAKSLQMIADYESRYGVHIYCKNYTDTYSKDEALKIVKTERRLELALESERFFDLVRWGEVAPVIISYLTKEKERLAFLSDAQFTLNRDEYLPIPHEQVASSNGHYQQNINWGE
jgi:hypothetical protein